MTLTRPKQIPDTPISSSVAGTLDRSAEVTRQVALRDFRQGDWANVVQLYREVFGKSAADAFAARWQWAHVANLYPLDSPKWVVECGDRVVGFLATIPLPYWINGKSVVAHT